jgi:hypothetical protein
MTKQTKRRTNKVIDFTKRKLEIYKKDQKEFKEYERDQMLDQKHSKDYFRIG